MATRSPKLLTTDEAAKRLGVNVQLVRRWCGQGRLGRKIGWAWVIAHEEVERFRRSGRKRPGTRTGRV